MPVRLPNPIARLFNRAARRSGDAVRRFDGASQSGRTFGFGAFGRISNEVAGANFTVRSRARYLAANNPFIANAVGNWVGALIGSGITAVPRHTDNEIRRALSAIFGDWADVADLDGRTDWYGLQAEVARAMVIDGESFIHVAITDDGPRLRLIPAELVDESMTRELENGAFIVQGVEFDTNGKRVAYWIFPSCPTDQFSTYAPPVRLPAEDVLHVFKPIAAGQVRGISWLAPVILPSNELDQLMDALLVGVKIAAMNAAFLVDLNGNGEPFEGDPSAISLEPGTVRRLPTGFDVKFNTPAQAREVASFLRLNLQQLAAGLGLPEHLLSGDLTGANYSSLRAGLLPFRQRVEAIQYHVVAQQFLNPIWKQVMTWAALSGAIDAPDFFDPTARRQWGAEWLPPKPLQVDPLKDTEATVAEIDAGLTSRRKAVAERGWILEDLDSEIAADTFKQKETTK